MKNGVENFEEDGFRGEPNITYKRQKHNKTNKNVL
jgi:hypothetical protein